ncbi:MAG: hypothetical protein ABJC62_05500 [Frankiaceae bacterium]
MRPLALGEILDGAFTVVRRHAKVTLAWSAIIVVLGQLITVAIGLLDGSLAAALDASGPSPLRGGALPGRGLSIVISAATGGVLTGVVSIIVSEAVLGRRPTFGEVWLRTRPRLLRLIGVAIAAGVLPLIGLVFLLVPGIFLWVALGLAPPALMLERLPVGAALRRSRRLVAGDWWRLFGIRTLAVLIGAALGAALAIPAALFGGLTVVRAANPGSLPLGALVVVAVVGVVASVLTQPFVSAVVALLYVDRRMRAEGLDVTLVQAVGGASPAPSRYGDPGMAGP